VSLKSGFDSLLDELKSFLPDHVISRVREEVEAKDVPDTVPEEKEGE
jgi:hypothetical protein